MVGEQQLTIDESTTDPVALQALFKQLDSGEEPAPTQTDEEREAEALAAKAVEDERLAAEAAAAKAAETDPPAADAKAAPKDAAQEPDADGVATRDGKHIIPYSVLQTERERATAATKALDAANARLAELEAAAKATTQGVKPELAAPNKANAHDLSDEDLAVLKEDFPTIYKATMALRAQAAAIEARLAPVQKAVEDDAATRRRSTDELIQEGIDATPKLAHLKATDPATFDMAAGFDKVLRTQPEWHGKSYADRFAKVIEMVEAAKGEIVIPGAAKAPPVATKSQDQLKAEAQAIAAAAAKVTKTGAPASLSDFPSGGAAAVDERAKVETMTTADLSKMFSKMSPDQMDAYLSTL